MQKSYTKNYIRIYLFQILSIILGFISLFIVVPYLSGNKSIYGIYTVCISITIFLSYADLGFLSAGLKFAAESFSRGEIEEEVQIIGFSHLILLFFVSFISLLFFYLSLHPEFLIHEIELNKQYFIAKKLLLILSIFSPTIILQRLAQTIFSIRLKDYIIQKINVLGNVVKISSVFYFFSDQNYDIVGYFLFVQIVNLLCSFITLYLAKKLFNYNFFALFQNFKLNKKIYNKTKYLAFSGLFVTISWVLYYELDSFAISKLMGPNQVAIYGIGLTILSFFRTLLGSFFSPFSNRFNHFIGENKIEELKIFYLHVITVSFPIVVFPIISVIIFAKPIIISWVGIEYEQSIDIASWLIACNIFAFISYPAGILISAKQNFKNIYFIAILMPIIHWTGVFITLKFYGVKSFAVFKSISFLISGIIYFKYSLSFLKLSIIDFIKREVFPHVPSMIFILLVLSNLNSLFVTTKNKHNLFINCGILSLTIFFSFVISIFFSKSLRIYFFKIFNILKNKQIEIQ